MFESVVKFLYHPVTAFTVLVTFLVIYMTFIDLEGGFSKGFLHFGPGTTPETTAKFIGINIDSWTKVIMLYVISFVSSLIYSYYKYAVNQNLETYAFQHAEKVVPVNKFWSYVILCSEPVIEQFLMVIQFFMVLTVQLQFIVPELLGNLCAHIPGVMQTLAVKEFDPDYLFKKK